MLQINLEDVKKAWEFRRLCNKTPLKDIEFLWEDKSVTENLIMIKEREEALFTLDEWLYTGLNNMDYMFMLLEVVDSSFEGAYSFSSETIQPNK